jgi:hypothetical protein
MASTAKRDISSTEEDLKSFRGPNNQLGLKNNRELNRISPRPISSKKAVIPLTLEVHKSVTTKDFSLTQTQKIPTYARTHNIKRPESSVKKPSTKNRIMLTEHKF